MKCNNCGFTVQHCPNCGNEFSSEFNGAELPALDEIVHCSSIKARIIAAFIGWGATFSAPPAFLPNVRFADKHVYIDDKLFCSAYSKVEGVHYEPDHIVFLLEQLDGDEFVDYRACITISWPFNAPPSVADISVEENPSGMYY